MGNARVRDLGELATTDLADKDDRLPSPRRSNRSIAAEAAAIRGERASASALPHADVIQQSFGRFSIDGIQAHQGGEAAEACESLGAHAYARGDSVVFGGEATLQRSAHEAAHVIEQRAGVAPRGVGAPGSRSEALADEVGATVASGRSAEPLLAAMTGRRDLEARSAAKQSVQMDWIDGAGEWLDDKVDGAKEAAGDAVDWAGDKVDDAKEAAGNAVDWAGEKAEDAGEWIEEKADSTVESARDAGEWIDEKAEDAGQWVEEKAKAGSDWLEEKMHGAAGGKTGDAMGTGITGWLFEEEKLEQPAERFMPDLEKKQKGVPDADELSILDVSKMGFAELIAAFDGHVADIHVKQFMAKRIHQLYTARAEALKTQVRSTQDDLRLKGVPLAGRAEELAERGTKISVDIIISQQNRGSAANASDTVVEECKIGWADLDIFDGRYKTWKGEVDAFVAPEKKAKLDKEQKEKVAARVRGYESRLSSISTSVFSAKLNLSAAADNPVGRLFHNHLAGTHLASAHSALTTLKSDVRGDADVMATIDATGLKPSVAAIASKAKDCVGIAVISGGFAPHGKAKNLHALAAGFFA